MSPEILAAIIGGLVALVSVLASSVVSLRSLRDSRELARQSALVQSQLLVAPRVLDAYQQLWMLLYQAQYQELGDEQVENLIGLTLWLSPEFRSNILTWIAGPRNLEGLAPLRAQLLEQSRPANQLKES